MRLAVLIMASQNSGKTSTIKYLINTYRSIFEYPSLREKLTAVLRQFLILTENRNYHIR